MGGATVADEAAQKESPDLWSGLHAVTERRGRSVSGSGEPVDGLSGRARGRVRSRAWRG